MSIEHEVLLDFVFMAKNEIQRIKTGYAPGPSMRDCVGQWEATVREAQKILREAAQSDTSLVDDLDDLR